MAASPSIAQHELDKPYLLRGARIRAFIMTSTLSLGMALVIFLLLVRLDGLDAFFQSALRTAAYFPPVMALIAASPLFFSLLIGYGYMSRAMNRRKREAEEAARRANAA